jgi:hypothetical protein
MAQMIADQHQIGSHYFLRTICGHFLSPFPQDGRLAEWNGLCFLKLKHLPFVFARQVLRAKEEDDGDRDDSRQGKPG